jgi:hypothetical protein
MNYLLSDLNEIDKNELDVEKTIKKKKFLEVE